MPLPPQFEARLESARMLTPGVRELVFERSDGAPMAFEAGQWVNVLLPMGPGPSLPLKRSYSIASAPDRSSRFEIAVTRVQGGPASTWLHTVAPGVVLPFSGPQGFFTRPLDRAGPSLLIGTGTGVTPLRSMIRAAIAVGSAHPLWLLLGVRHEEDLLYANELRALCERNHFLRFEATLSRPSERWEGRRGYVQAHLRDIWNELAEGGAIKPHAYVCGLQRMVQSVREILRTELGAAREQVHSERYD